MILFHVQTTFCNQADETTEDIISLFVRENFFIASKNYFCHNSNTHHPKMLFTKAF